MRRTDWDRVTLQLNHAKSATKTKSTRQQGHGLLLQLLAKSSHCSNKVTHSQSHAYISYTQTYCIYSNPPHPSTPGHILKIGLRFSSVSRRVLMSSRTNCMKTRAARQFAACPHLWDTCAARHTLCSHLINETGGQTEAQFSAYTQDGWCLLGAIVFTVRRHHKWSVVILRVSISSNGIFPAALWVRQQSNDWLTPGFRDGLLWYAPLANLMRSTQQPSSG